MIRTVIVDDEPLARDGLRLRLGREPDVELVAEAAGGDEAVEAIRRLEPDLVFLDVQMPGCDGFQVIERIADAHLPVIVFVSAFDRHAVRAFDVHALDYLLKPVEDDRFAEAMRRARRELELGTERGSPARLSSLLDQIAPAPGAGGPLTRFVVRRGQRFVLVNAAEVRWIRSAGNYAELHTAQATHLVRTTLSELERRLDPRQFARVHRTVIVRIDEVAEIEPTPAGDFELVLREGTRLPMSRTHRGRLLT
jgi:two-component system LytT family response regulator